MCQCVFFSWPLSKSENVLHLSFSRNFCDHLVFFIFVINQKNYYRNCLTNSEIRVGGLVYMYFTHYSIYPYEIYHDNQLTF